MLCLWVFKYKTGSGKFLYGGEVRRGGGKLCYLMLVYRRDHSPLHDGIVAEFDVYSPGAFVQSGLSHLHRALLVVDRLPQESDRPLHVSDLPVHLQDDTHLETRPVICFPSLVTARSLNGHNTYTNVPLLHRLLIIKSTVIKL